MKKIGESKSASFWLIDYCEASFAPPQIDLPLMFFNTLVHCPKSWQPTGARRCTLAGYNEDDLLMKGKKVKKTLCRQQCANLVYQLADLHRNWVG